MNEKITLVLGVLAISFMISSMVVVFTTSYDDIFSGFAGNKWWIKISVVPGILGYTVSIAAILIFSIVQTGDFLSCVFNKIKKAKHE